MKKCTICKNVKPLEDFNKKKRSSDGRQNICRVCSKEKYKSYYKTNNEFERARLLARKLELRQKLQEFKNSVKCEFCPEDDPCCLDFHHKDPQKKDFTLANAAVKGMAWDRIKEEIDKCVVACANCHRKIHAGKIDINSPVV